MPRRTTHNDTQSILKRARTQRSRARKEGEPVENQEDRKRKEKMHFFPMSAIDSLHLTYQGQETAIGRLTQEQFREWFCGVVDAALPYVRGSAFLILTHARTECRQYDEIDKYVKFDLLNTLYEMSSFRQSGVAFVDEAEMESRHLPANDQPEKCLCGCGKDLMSVTKKGGNVRKFYSTACRLRYVRRQKRKAVTPKTHCPQGHPYDEENTYIGTNGYRNCRTCHKLRKRELRHQRKQEQAS